MQFSVLTLFTLVAAVMAVANDNVRRQDQGQDQDIVVDVEQPAMTDKNGNVVAFNPAGVNQANLDAGL